jgi:hypothetical protein
VPRLILPLMVLGVFFYVAALGPRKLVRPYVRPLLVLSVCMLGAAAALTLVSLLVIYFGGSVP